jgi:hypothetical protein
MHFSGRRLPQFHTPLSHRFRGDDDPALGEKLFDITKTEREAEIPPKSMADHFRWEAKTCVVGGKRVWFHEAILA